MDIDIIINCSPDAVLKNIAVRVKEKRLERNLTQKSFAKRAGVGYDAYRKFESSGEITLRNLVLCAIILDDLEGFTELFVQKKWQNLDELLKNEKHIKRKRGKKNE
jgi:transcriptional regulator with XRE-family HTH domain